MTWQPYKSCCHKAALDADSAFCGDCGHTLFRCMAFDDCLSLATSREPCPVCIQPELFIEKGAMLQARPGERLVIPLVLRNASKVQRTLHISEILVAQGGQSLPVQLPWQQLDPQGERAFDIETTPFQDGGRHTLRLTLTLASRFKNREEIYAYAATLVVTIAADARAQVNVNFAHNDFGQNPLLNIPIHMQDTADAPAALAARLAVPLGRSESFEMRLGLRGYKTPQEARVLRDAAFVFHGFAVADRPKDGGPVGPGGTLSFGRAERRFDAATNPAPGDVTLRMYKTDGEVDAELTGFVSRQHFELFIMNDRLCLRARSGNGVTVNDDKLALGHVRVVQDGDSIVPLSGRPDLLTLRARFRTGFGSVEAVDIFREPAAGR